MSHLKLVDSTTVFGHAILNAIDEGLELAQSGLNKSDKNVTDLKAKLIPGMPVAEEVKTLKLIAHEFCTYAYWLEQREFWRERKKFAVRS